MAEVAIIIVNFNSDELTSQCLKSIVAADIGNHQVQVIVVDNGSATEYALPKALRKLKWIDVIRSESNLGFTGGNNMGIEYAIEKQSVDYVMLINNDTVVHEQLFNHLINYLEVHPECGIISPKIYFQAGREYFYDSYQDDDRGRVIWYAGGSIDWDNLSAFHRGVDEIDKGQFAEQTKSDFATGCCLLLKREILEKIGSLDNDYFLYFEDTDLSMRVKNLGYEIHYSDEAKVWHVNAGSSDGVGSSLHQYFQNRNRLIFFFRYGDWRTKFNVGRVFFQLLSSKNPLDRKAATHFVLHQWGKQPVI